MDLFVLSDDSINSHGFRIDMSKLDLGRFKENPVMLYEHREVIGRWKDIELKDNKLTAAPEFMDMEGESEAKRVKQRVDNGYLKGASLGMIIKKITIDEEKDDRVAEVEVLEASIVSVPSNANSMKLHYADGRVAEDLEMYLSAVPTVYLNRKQTETIMKLSNETLKKLNLSEEATITQVGDAINELHAKYNDLVEGQKKESEARIEEKLNAAVRVGKIDASEKEHYKKIGEVDEQLLSATLDKLSGKQPLPPGRREESKETTGDFSDMELSAMEKEDPERFLKIIENTHKLK